MTVGLFIEKENVQIEELVESYDIVTARTWADVDLGALADNVRTLATLLPERTDVLMTVKANAYGHGLVPVARAAVDAGVWGFGVAALDEAAALREAGIEAAIVCMMPVIPEDAARAVALDAIPSLTDAALGEAVDAAARAAGKRQKVHVEVDSGMGRAGVRDGVLVPHAAPAHPGVDLDLDLRPPAGGPSGGGDRPGSGRSSSEPSPARSSSTVRLR